MSLEIQVKILDMAGLPLPDYMTEESGRSVTANADPVTVQPQQVALIPTGIMLAIPTGFEARYGPRSGLG